jgi:hypothetical protein
MRFRSVALGWALLALVAFVPAGSQAAGSQAAGAAVYSVKGTMTILPSKSIVGSGSWSLSGKVMLTTGGARLPKAGTLRASGRFGVVSVIRQPAGTIRTEAGATNGVLTIVWTDGKEPPKRFTLVHIWAHPIDIQGLRSHPQHILTGIPSGLGHSGGVVATLHHTTNNGVTGQLILVESGTSTK